MSEYIAIGHATTPYFTLLSHSSGSVSLATTYATLGGGSTTLPRGVRFNKTNEYIAIGHSASSIRFTLLNHSSGSVSLATTYLTAGTINRVEWSNDDAYIAIGHADTPYFTLLSHSSGSVSLATTYVGNSTNQFASWHPNDTYITTTHNTTPYFTLLSHSSGSVSLATTYTLQGLGYAATFSPDGNYIAAGHLNAPYFTMLNHSSGSVSLATTYTLPGLGRNAVFTKNGDYVGISHNASPYFTMFSFSSGVLTRTGANTSATGNPQNTASISPNDQYIPFGGTTNPRFFLLENDAGTISTVATYTVPSTVYSTHFTNAEEAGLTANIKISGTFVDKPLMIKKSGTFEQVGAKQVGGWV